MAEKEKLNRLRVVLAEKEKSGRWLAKQMGLSEYTVSRWVTNKQQPSVPQLYEIARHLEVEVAALLVPHGIPDTERGL